MPLIQYFHPFEHAYKAALKLVTHLTGLLPHLYRWQIPRGPQSFLRVCANTEGMYVFTSFQSMQSLKIFYLVLYLFVCLCDVHLWFFLPACLFATCVPGAHRDRKRVSNYLELELEMVVSV